MNKFVGLLADGWDVHIICQKSQASEWERFPALQARPEIKQRVHKQWPHQPGWLVIFLLPLLLLLTIAHNPRGSWAYLRKGWSEKGWRVLKLFFLDAPIIKLKPELIHFEFGSLAPDRIYLQNWLACKATLSFRGYDINYVGLDEPNYYQNVWNNADGIHFLGQDLWRRALRRGCPMDMNHALIPPAIDVSLFSPCAKAKPELDERPLRILSVGRLEWKKGYEYALRAMKLLKQRGVSFQYHIVGDGKSLGPLSFLKQDYGLDDEVQFLGAMPQADVIEQMNWADVFLHTAVSEGFCNAVIEAQAMKLPVVTSDADGLAENVCDGETGFVVIRRQPEMFADKISYLADNPKLRYTMGMAGRKRAETQFQIQDQIQAFSNFYRQILAIDV